MVPGPNLFDSTILRNSGKYSDESRQAATNYSYRAGVLYASATFSRTLSPAYSIDALTRSSSRTTLGTSADSIEPRGDGDVR